MPRPVPHLLLLGTLLLAGAPQPAHAQFDAPTPLEEVDPDAPPRRAPAPVPVEDAPDYADDVDDGEARVVPPPMPAVVRPPARRDVDDRPAVTPPPSPAGADRFDSGSASKKKPASKKEAPPEPEPPKDAAPLEIPPVRVTQKTDAELRALWEAYKKSYEGMDRRGADAALAELIVLKQELGISDLESFSVAAGRAAQKRAEGNDPVGSIELAGAAVKLAPRLPYAHFARARAYFASDPTDVSRWSASLKDTVSAFVADPRYLRPALGDLFTALLAALLATAGAVVGILFIRRVRYFLHDFHHLFPRGAAKWQTAPLAVLLLSLPLVFRLGFIPVLLALFVSVTLYLGWKERIVGAAAIALAGLLPFFGGLAAHHTSFSGTRAEALYQLERGGLEASDAAAVVRARVQSGLGDFPDLFALGRYELRRGHLELAGELFKKAALLRADDPRLLVNLGNTRFGLNDLAGAHAHYTRATQLDPTLAAAFYDLSRVHQRRALALTDSAKAMELEKAQTAEATAHQLDPTLVARPDPPPDADLNTAVLGAELSWSELRALAEVRDTGPGVADQLSTRLMGMGSSPLTLLLPALLALVALGLGGFRETVVAAAACSRCGRAVCRRCDRDMGFGGGLCSQCVNVFARKAAVAPQVKVRKQLEVDRYEVRQERLAWLFGILCSGAGHLFWGAPVRGALFAFGFLFTIFLAVFREGVLRAPYGELPLAFRLVPAGLLLVVIYLLSLRSLRKAQAG